MKAHETLTSTLYGGCIFRLCKLLIYIIASGTFTMRFHSLQTLEKTKPVNNKSKKKYISKKFKYLGMDLV